MAERAHPDDPLWRRQFLFFPTPALKYLVRRYKFCRPYVLGRRVLDVPCGNGMGFRFLGRSSFLVGADLSIEATNLTLSRFGGHAGVATDMTSLPFKTGSFGAVVCLEGIEHIDRRAGQQFLEEAARVISPGGWFLLSCPVLREDGMHSGNAFHLYEWKKTELVACVESLFQIVNRKAIRGPAGNVQMIAARRPKGAEITLTLMSSGPDVRYEKAIESAEDWIESQWVGPRARYGEEEETTLLATTFAILASETLGSLARWSPQRVKDVAAGVLEYQDAETGYFGSHLVRDEDLLAQPTCDKQYVINQITYFSLAALSALGFRPQYRLTFALSLLESDGLRKHINDGPWRDIWNQSNRLMFVLRYLIHLMGEPKYAASANSAFDTVLSEIEERQDSKTGLWFGEGVRDHRWGVYAAYHFAPFFLWRGRRLKRVDKIIDSVLGIQSPEGLFADSIGGGACEDLDAIDLLVKLSYLSDHRSEDVCLGLRRAFDRILQLQCGNGGFPNYLRSLSAPSWKRRLVRRLGLSRTVERWRPIPLERSHYSGWTAVSVLSGAPDMWGTWFRTLALNQIVEKMPVLGTPPENARFHSLPALGWHDQVALKCSYAAYRSNSQGRNR